MQYALPYDPLVWYYFDEQKQLHYTPDDMFLSSNPHLEDDPFISLQWRIKSMDDGKGVAQLECVTHCEYDGACDWVSLAYLKKLLETQET